MFTLFPSSEVVGRPLAALLANDGARVFSVDVNSIQVCKLKQSSNTFHSLHFSPPRNIRSDLR